MEEKKISNKAGVNRADKSWPNSSRSIRGTRKNISRKKTRTDSNSRNNSDGIRTVRIRIRSRSSMHER